MDSPWMCLFINLRIGLSYRLTFANQFNQLCTWWSTQTRTAHVLVSRLEIDCSIVGRLPGVILNPIVFFFPPSCFAYWWNDRNEEDRWVKYFGVIIFILRDLLELEHYCFLSDSLVTNILVPVGTCMYPCSYSKLLIFQYQFIEQYM